MAQNQTPPGDVVAAPGHPLHTLMAEHRALLGFAARLNEAAAGPAGSSAAAVQEIAGYIKESASHYEREENVIFPALEKHGVTQPPAVMWMEHDRIRQIEKDLFQLLEAQPGLAAGQFAARLQSAAAVLADTLAAHFQKENSILFPMAMQVLDDAEWPGLRRQFDEIGYCSFSPVVQPVAAAAPAPAGMGDGMVRFASGAMSLQQIELLLNTLPVDITFVDEHDCVAYFSQGRDRIFLRTESVIGRSVQLCHPEKSIHVVNQILDDFRHGRRDDAAFWINMQGHMIHIRYFAVRDAAGGYRGCLEVTQDISDIRKLAGEKRLLD